MFALRNDGTILKIVCGVNNSVKFYYFEIIDKKLKSSMKLIVYLFYRITHGVRTAKSQQY